MGAGQRSGRFPHNAVTAMAQCSCGNRTECVLTQLELLRLFDKSMHILQANRVTIAVLNTGHDRGSNANSMRASGAGFGQDDPKVSASTRESLACEPRCRERQRPHRWGSFSQTFHDRRVPDHGHGLGRVSGHWPCPAGVAAACASGPRSQHLCGRSQFESSQVHHAFFVTARFPETAKKPAIGGRRRFGLRGDFSRAKSTRSMRW
jgi:hypothetical protein